MESKIIVLILSFAACLAIETSLNAVTAKPVAEGPSELTVILNTGAEKIARAILDNDPNVVEATLNDIQDFLMHKDTEFILKRVKKLTSTVTTNLTTRGYGSLRTLDNEAGKLFIAKQDETISRLLATRARYPESGEFDLIKYWMNPPVERYLKKDTGYISSLAFSPDSNLLASGTINEFMGGFRGSITIWNVERGKELLSITSEPIRKLIFSPDGTSVAYGAGDYPNIKLWNFAEGTIDPEYLRGDFDEKGGVYKLAFSPDGKFLAGATTGSMDFIVSVWDVKNRKKILQRERGKPNAVIFSPDGTVLAFFACNFMTRRCIAQLINRDAGYIVQEINIESPPEKISSSAFAPNVKLLAVGTEDGIIRIWNIDENREISRLATSERSSPYCLAFSPDGKLLITGYNDGTVRLWNVETATEIWQKSRDIDKIPLDLVFSPDGKTIAVGYNDGAIRLIWAWAREQPGPKEIEPEYSGID